MNNIHEEWDPMKEDFDNPEFNTYLDGPGRNLNSYFQQCNNNRRENGKLIELFVGNVPPELNESGLKNIFLHFGKPLRVHKPAKGKSQNAFAFVTFGNQSEADAAIRGLHKVKPFFLRVKYALTNQEKDAINKFKEHNESVIKTLSEEPANPIPTKPTKTGISRGKMINRLRLETIINNCWKNLRKPNNDPIGKMRFYQNSKYENCNALLCDEYCKIRQQMEETKFKKVTMTLTCGRGHVLPSSKLLINKNEQPISIDNFPKNFGILPKIDSMQECIRCGFLAQMACLCNTPYCSKSCQINDWAEHRLECNESDLNNDVITLTKINNEAKEDLDAYKLNGIMDIVIMMQCGVGEYWVIQKEHLKILSNINEKLEKFTCNSPDCKLEIGELCAVQIEGNWLRGKILTLLPKLMVRLIDYGDDYFVMPNQIKSLSPDEESIQSLAFRIKIKRDLPDCYNELEEGKEIKIKILKLSSQGAYIVDVLNSEENIESTIQFNNQYLISKPQKPLTSILNMPIKNSLGKLKFVSQMRGKFSGTVILSYPNFEILQNQLYDLASAVVNMPENPPNWRPRQNLLVATCWKGNWFRGYVLGFIDEIYVVALCDEGIVALTKTIRPVPKHFDEVPELSVFCTIPDNERITWDKAQEYDCKIVYSENDMYICQILTNGEEIASLELERWKPRVEDFGFHLDSIPNESKVLITCYHSQNWVSVRPINPKVNQEYLKMIQDINLHCLLVDKLDRPPYIGELVANRYDGDGNWYRAYVNRIEKENVHIVYIDCGNHDIVPIKHLKPLSTKLKLRTVQTMLIQLDDIPDGYINQDIINYFYELIINQISLKIVYSPDQIDLPAKLYMTKRNNNSICMDNNVNLELKDLMKPKWKKIMDDGKNPAEKVFMIDHLKSIKISKREKFPFVVLAFLDVPQFYGVRFDSDITFTVLEQLNGEMETYFNATPVRPYVPRQNEICIVYYYKDNRYYRAVNLEAFTNTCRLTFIDFGYQDEIEYINIRKIIPDFMILPNIGILFHLHGLRENLKPSEWAEISTLINLNTIYSADIVSIENDVAFVDLLDLQDQLKKFKE